MNLDVLVAGELYVDMVMSGFDGWPHLGQEAFAKEFRREAGGAAITACGLARLGTRTGVLGAVGEDFGPWIVDRLRQNGVDTSQIRCDSAEPTGITVAIATPQDRTFFTYPGANRLLPAILEEVSAPARHVHLACAPPLDTALKLLTAIRRAGSVSVDPGWHEAWLRDPRALSLLPMIDLFFPNLDEGRCMTGEQDPARILARLGAAGAERVALKLGAAGAALLWEGKILFADPPPVNPIDPTGAGDGFDAGFLHMWLRGESPENCLRAANICGALSTEALGGIAGFPSAELLEQALLDQAMVNPCAKLL